jgi:hypothetical protein
VYVSSYSHLSVELLSDCGWAVAGCSSPTSWLGTLLPSWVVRYWPVIQRLMVTLVMLTVIRMGYFIPIPGVDLTSLPAAGYGLEGEMTYGSWKQLGASTRPAMWAL